MSLSKLSALSLRPRLQNFPRFPPILTKTVIVQLWLTLVIPDMFRMLLLVSSTYQMIQVIESGMTSYLVESVGQQVLNVEDKLIQKSKVQFMKNDFWNS
ncbi:hypothetical protein ACTXT7_002789 [Hymenolepis weldensis]